MIVDLDAIPDAFETRVGLPRPNWRSIRTWIAANLAEADQHEVWTEAARQWLTKLQNALPSGYILVETEEFFLLLSGDADLNERIAYWCESYRRKIVERLPNVARKHGVGKHVLLAFADQEIYYDYISDYYFKDGKYGTSIGSLLCDGYYHIALWTTVHSQIAPTIAHELTHNLLKHLPLPHWLEEGITQVMEEVVLESTRFVLALETARRHRAYWNEARIQEFWSGASFYRSGKAQTLSYSLAEVLLRNIISDYKSKVLDFIRAANYADAGENAALNVLGVSLNDRVAQFLGSGNWRPSLPSPTD